MNTDIKAVQLSDETLFYRLFQVLKGRLRIERRLNLLT